MKSLFSEDKESSNNSPNASARKIGLILIGITGGTAVALSVVCFPFVSPALRKICLPYVPATGTQVENVMSALRGRSGSLIDLGSGDGRIVIKTAKAGFLADGVELNPWLVGYSRIAALADGLASRTTFFRTDLWQHNLRPYNNVVIFGVEEMMADIEKKFISELKGDCTIVACRFPLPSARPVAIIGHGVDTVWMYKTPLEEA